MSGYKIKFNGLDRIYSYYKKDLDQAAKDVWRTGNVLIGRKKGNVIFTSEPSGFMNMVDKYILLRDNSYGYFSNKILYLVIRPK